MSKIYYHIFLALSFLKIQNLYKNQNIKRAIIKGRTSLIYVYQTAYVDRTCMRKKVQQILQ